MHIYIFLILRISILVFLKSCKLKCCNSTADLKLLADGEICMHIYVYNLIMKSNRNTFEKDHEQANAS